MQLVCVGSCGPTIILAYPMRAILIANYVGIESLDVMRSIMLAIASTNI